MKIIKELPIVILASLAFTACSDNDTETPSTVDTKAWTLDAQMDTSYTPGNNFFMYCNGTWYKNTDLGNNSSAGFIEDGAVESRKRVANMNDATVNQFWADTTTFHAPVASALSVIEANVHVFDNITTQAEAWTAIGKAMAMGYHPIIKMEIYETKGKEYGYFDYADTAEYKLLSAAASYLPRLGYSNAEATKISRLATSALNKLEKYRGGMSLTFDNLKKHPELNELMVPLKSIGTRGTGSDALDAIAAALGISTDDIYVKTDWLSMYQALETVTPAEIQAILQAGIAQDMMYVSQENLDAYNQTRGSKETLSTIAKNVYTRYMPYIVSHAFASKYVSAELKSKVLSICEELRSTFNKRIDNLTWMSSTTKAYAHEKLNAMIFNVGYPDTWIQEGLPTLEGKSLAEDVIQLRKSYFALRKSLVGKGRQEVSFHNIISTPTYDLTLFNAMYNPNANSMNIYPAFMTSPMLDETKSDAMNYATCVVFGHEITHGFDNSGAKYDKEGTYSNWWTVQDQMDFEARQQLLIDCFNHLEIGDGREELEGICNNGTKTLGENIADQGGFELAHDTYMAKLEKDGYTGDEKIKQEKKFYQAYANLWRRKFSVPAMLYLQSIDEHSSAKERINGTVMNNDRWYELYNVKWGNTLYLKPEKRSHIW